MRSLASVPSLTGLVLARDLRDERGHLVLPKGQALSATDATRALRAEWTEIHAIMLEAGDIHESEAGVRLARAVAGDGIEVGEYSAGAWPLRATRRGVVAVAIERLRCVNEVDGLCVYSLFDGQVVDVGEAVARSKIVPFAVADEALTRGEALAREGQGVLRVRAFRPMRIGAVVQESLGSSAMARFRAAFAEKVAWFGSSLLAPAFVRSEEDAVADAIRSVIAQGAEVVAVAGSKAMDLMDPAFVAMERIGASMERHGVPAHPGSLFWLAYLGDVPILGMPSCGLFSRATVLDLVLPRVLAGERLTSGGLAALGHGGFLTRHMAFRFPPYRPARERGEVE